MAESLAFRAWAKEEGLVLKADLATFNGKHVAFNAGDYLTSKLTDPQTREPLLPALGGLPFALKQNVDYDLERLRQAGIKPTFIFQGLDLVCRDRETLLKESKRATGLLDEAWRVYDQGRGDEAVVAFGKACTYRSNHITRWLLYYLHQKGIRVRVAPYDAAAELFIYHAVHKEGRMVDAVVGSASELMFGIKRVIFGFDWDNKGREVAFVEREKVLEKLDLRQHQFVDLCLLAGCSFLTTMPELETADPTVSKIPAARARLARANLDGYTACLQANDEPYLKLFQKAKTAVKHMVVVQFDGKIKQLAFDDSPTDLHEIIGQRLPNEMFVYQYFGLVGQRVLNWRVKHEILETPPLDGGTSPAYKDLILEKLRPMRARTQAVLTHSLHRYWHKVDVTQVYSLSEDAKRPLGIVDMPLEVDSITRDADSWHVREALLDQSAETKNISLNDSPIQFAIALLSDESLAKKTVTRKKDGEHSILNRFKELLSNTMWRFLQDRGYINSDHTLSAWGKALKAAFERARSDGYLGKTDPINEAEEAIFIAFELLRMDALSSLNLFPNPPYLGAPQRGSDTDKANVLLISRIASLGTFKHDAIGYTGPLSRHLLAFHQMAAQVRNSLRDLAEIHACNMLLSGSVVRDRDREEFADLGARISFNKEPDLGLALVVKSYLDELSQEASRRTDIRKWFNHALDIEGDLQKTWKMWDAINAGVQAADSAIVSSDTKNRFQDTDLWLAEKRLAGMHVSVNGTTNGTNGAS